MDRSYIINYLADKINAKSYLEIGIGDGINFKSIKCENKISIDIDPIQKPMIVISSDEYFSKYSEKFDIIFIDGLHHAEQVHRDILNSLNVLNDGGVILCHDTMPHDEKMQTVPIHDGMWCGDVWKAIVDIRQTIPNIEVTTLDVETGLTIIRRGAQEILNVNGTVDYFTFTHNKYKWLNIMNLIEFYAWNLSDNIHLDLINHYIHNSESDRINFYLGKYYEDIGHTASAVSFYVRCAERTNIDELKYEAMLRAACCFDSQGSRGISVCGLLQHAIALLPSRPEGYFLLARYYERSQRWFDGYMIASIGLQLANFDSPRLRTNVDYPGKYGIIFEKAVVAWWCGLCEESMNTFKLLLSYEIMEDQFRWASINNLNTLSQTNWTFPTIEDELSASHQHLNLYTNTVFNNLKVKFNGSDKIKRNYSEAFQDMFVLTMLNGKRNGTYVEIGAGNPIYGNNTYLLESNFDWTGISLDIDSFFIDRFEERRTNTAITCDALDVNYTELFESNKLPHEIDYLQIDCDPADVTYNILKRIPFERYKFRIITYEHDHYVDPNNSYKDRSRLFLTKMGYRLAVSNISPSENRNFEDWYIHPELVSDSILLQLDNPNSHIVKEANTILINQL